MPEWAKQNLEFENLEAFAGLLRDNEDNWQKKVIANYQPFSHWKEDSSRKIEKDFLPLLKMSFKSCEKDLKSFFNYYNSLPDDANKSYKCKQHIFDIAFSESATKRDHNDDGLSLERNVDPRSRTGVPA